VPRLWLVSLVAVLLVVAAAPSASAKGRVTASLDRPTRCDAAPGTRITIAFSLTTYAAAGAEPFGAGGVFVKLRRAGGRPAIKATARSDRTGHYVARVTVPRGGILRINAGLEGTTTAAGGKVSDADLLFPTRNDPCRAPR
jgi:hypothetical protein